jgi:phosphopantetheine--protein transferase-like protein
VGVDVEATRRVDMAAGRFFLTDAERAWVEQQPPAERSGHLLRLWTVKEALFKATSENVSTMLADYAVCDPAARAGRGGLLRDAHRAVRYASTSSPGGVVTVAVNAD